MHIGQVVVLVEDLDEVLPVASDFEFTAPGRNQISHGPWAVQLGKVAEPDIDVLAIRLETEKRETVTLGGAANGTSPYSDLSKFFVCSMRGVPARRPSSL